MGVIAVYGVEGAARVMYSGLHMLQHRGQEGAGMVVFDQGGKGVHHRGLGLVSEVFGHSPFLKQEGSIGIGGTQYANAAKGGLDNVQPLFFQHKSGDFAVAGDGNLVNYRQIKDYLENRGSIFHTSTDAELLANLIKKTSSEARIYHIVCALNMMEGGFAFVILTKNRIYACRDKYGIKPLCIGRLGNGYVVASESCAFDYIGATMLRDVAPGEVVTIDDHGLRSRQYSKFQRRMMCGMEYIYLARPDSDIDGCNVHAFRKESGRRLYREQPAEADIVVGVPDSSLSAAIGYAEESGIPYEMGLVKNRYVARTFIMPVQEDRMRVVHLKLSAVRSIVSGKRIVMVDDSIVRGTTSLQIVNLLREAGAREVHVRIASPMMKHPCYYGVDTPTEEELLCSHRDLEEARKAIGADSLGYLSCEGAIASSFGCSDLCLACFNGNYPTALYQMEYEQDEE
ncbi:MAG: amidophosphoribosyltransferase [Bacteroidales bacterium]|nr:amidophosphoribosyltransferase [Bacteroidales bacterium]MBP5390013.1 amidophosphoribosyltransferase [Bacteroidales bacterium]MBP5635343.1 amidophosphoribosyltransferase [Bacteroidales bacterium]